MLDLLDGLILAGGADIDPATYGEAPHAATAGTRRERDDFEVALARRALERDIPLLGICRGMQLMNVARGGTLTQHLPDDVGHEDHRRVPGSFDGADHDVRLAGGSLAARAAGETDHATKSHHHQGVAQLGDGLVDDGLEHARRAARGDRGPERRFALGVQWHPEADPASQLIASLVREARAQGAERRLTEPRIRRGAELCSPALCAGRPPSEWRRARRSPRGSRRRWCAAA